MLVTGTQIAYFHLCHRKLWLFAHHIQMEQRSELVAEGKWLEQNSYEQRAHRWQELAIEGIKIDHFDPKRGIVKEVKKSNKREAAHVAQLRYYMYVLERNGIAVSHGLLEYPSLRLREKVWLNEALREEIGQWEKEVQSILSQAFCPAVIPKSLCRKCAYQEFCYVN